MTLLAIDIGNSRIKAGIFKGKKLSGEMLFPTTPSFGTAKFWTELKKLLRDHAVSRHAITGAVISSVVPPLTIKLTAFINRRFRVKTLVVTGTMDTGLCIRYRNPQTLGADRICSAVAAYHRYGGPLIIIDMGTAVTYNVVSKEGVFLGGAIAPGLWTASTVLHEQTAKLPNVMLQFPRSIVGKTTIENIQSGILYGMVGAIEGIIKRMKRITGKRTKIFLTGGGAYLIKSKIDIDSYVIPSLVLHGARIIYERQQKLPVRVGSKKKKQGKLSHSPCYCR